MAKEAIHDVAIIGAGTMGIATAAFLAQRNVKTLLIDAFDPPHIDGTKPVSTSLKKPGSSVLTRRIRPSFRIQLRLPTSVTFRQRC